MTNSSISKTWTLLDALSAKGKSKVGKGEQRMLEARNGPAGKAAWNQASRVVLTGQPVVLTHLTLQSECCVPNKPLGPAASPVTLLAGTSPGSAYKQTG